MKCLPQEKVEAANGNVIHDSHAEILALRAFNRFVLDECRGLARGGDESDWIRWRDGQRGTGEDGGGVNGEAKRLDPPFEMQEDTTIHLYISEAPCGDASMELTMRAQADPSPWTSSVPPPTTNDTPSPPPMLGRGHFDQLGIVRRKPARPDAPVTMSKSCSDKLALKQCTGLLSALTSRLVDPGNVYLSSLVLPTSQIVPSAIARAFGPAGRMAPLTDPEMQERWGREGGYAFRPFEVRGTEREFEYSKRILGEEAVPSNLSAVLAGERQEVLVNGAVQGRKQGDPRGASCVGRRRMWEGTTEILDLLGIKVKPEAKTYGDRKRGRGAKARARVKADVRELALKGWVKGTGDESWGLDSDGV